MGFARYFGSARHLAVWLSEEVLRVDVDIGLDAARRSVGGGDPGAHVSGEVGVAARVGEQAEAVAASAQVRPLRPSRR